MTELKESGVEGIEALVASARSAGRRPPVNLWNPPDCGVIDMRIASDGTWFYQRTPIGRPALVRLFASVLRREGERHVLVTPAEKVTIVVEDAPFLAVEMRVEDTPERSIAFRTNVDDWILAGPDHPIRFEHDATGGLKPYVLVRDALWAKVSRSLMYDLVEIAAERDVDGVATLGVVSRGAFFAMARASALEEAR